jgi:hypothetical protein
MPFIRIVVGKQRRISRKAEKPGVLITMIVREIKKSY